jgi:hypothetical protein
VNLQREIRHELVQPAVLLPPAGVLPQSAQSTTEAVNGTALVRDMEAFFNRYVVLPPKASLPLALWAMTTYLFESFDAFPYLAVSSPAPQCGKTRLLEAAELVVCNPRRASNIREAALFRVIEKFKPTLMLGEAETLKGKSERAEYLRQIINAGNRKGAVATRCIGQGASLDVKDYSVYCPKVVSGIGTSPPTITDRAICISMQRRKKTDSIEKFFIRAVTPEAAALKRRAVEFAGKNCEEIEVAYGRIALEFLGDRDADSWSPLFATLAVAEPARLPELRDCAEHLTAAKTDIATDDSVHLRLLADMQAVWAKSEPCIFSKDLTARLRDIEDGSWGEKEIDLTQRKLARMLKGFKLQSSTVRIGDDTAKGYSREEFEEASFPYLKPNTSQASQPA